MRRYVNTDAAYGDALGFPSPFLREYLGWSGAQFAKHMGVTRHQVSRWEHGTALSTVADRLVRAFVLLKNPVDDYSIDDFGAPPIAWTV